MSESNIASSSNISKYDEIISDHNYQSYIDELLNNKCFDELLNITIIQTHVCQVESSSSDLKIFCNKWFAKFGTIRNIKFHSNSQSTLITAYIMYINPNSVINAINYINNGNCHFNDKTVLKATFGLQKYCPSFIIYDKCNKNNNFCNFRHSWVLYKNEIIINNNKNINYTDPYNILQYVNYSQYENTKISLAQYRPQMKVITESQYENTEIPLAQYRPQMKVIAENEFQFDLSLFHALYFKYFNSNIRASYYGKLKDLLLYFNDIFHLECKKSTVTVMSKIYQFKVINNHNLSFPMLSLFIIICISVVCKNNIYRFVIDYTRAEKERITLDVFKNESIKNILYKLQSKIGININNILLTYKSKLLNPKYTIDHYGIMSRCTIHCNVISKNKNFNKVQQQNNYHKKYDKLNIDTKYNK